MIQDFPPSPALSACDSLDGDELDAWLDAQGPLSRFGTPPPPRDKAVMVEVVELLDEHDEVEDAPRNADYGRISLHFADQLSEHASEHLEDASLIQDVLTIAGLPPGFLALTYNILARYSTLRLLRQTSLFQVDLLTVAAMSLTVSYINDAAPRSSWWAREVCKMRYSPAQINAAVMDLLAALEWSLHGLAVPHALDRSMVVLSSSRTYAVPEHIRDLASQPKTEPLKIKIKIDGAAASWSDGQATPDDTPPASAVDSFLRLL